MSERFRFFLPSTRNDVTERVLLERNRQLSKQCRHAEAYKRGYDRLVQLHYPNTVPGSK